ncbi:hypothetical protein EJB05_26457 [Eragrostis curvula]|uniref:Uncharacterized protein n=1 Tax=Eragrostis curvula TaxID=38414 RepID=A0A5J9UK25_9POAL|nr:hypothetical protein EJB05_26457 [Eragrostis curvula]
MGGIAGKRPRVATLPGASDDAASPPRRLRRERAVEDGARSPDAMRRKDGVFVGGAGIDEEPVSAGTESDDEAVSVATETGDEAVSASSSLGSEEEEEAANYFSAEELFLLSEVDDFSSGFDCYRQDVSSNRSNAELAASTSNMVKAAFSSTIDAQNTHWTGKEGQITYGNDPQCMEKGMDLPGKKPPERQIKDQGPLAKEAYKDARKAEAEVHKLYESARNVKVSISKKNKVELMQSSIDDRKLLSQQKGKTCEINASSLPYLYTKPSVRGFRRPQKKKGFDLVMWRGKLAMPSCSRTGNSSIDRMNEILFELYQKVDRLLKKDDVASTLVQFGYLSEVDHKKDLKDALCMLRRSAHTIRVMILDLGMLPLLEPVEFWGPKLPEYKV